MMNNATAIVPTKIASRLNFMMTFPLSNMKIGPAGQGVSEFISNHHVLWQVSTVGALSAVTAVTFRGEIRQAVRCFAAHRTRWKQHRVPPAISWPLPANLGI